MLEGDRFRGEVRALDEAGSGIVEVADGAEAVLIHVAGALPSERISGHVTYRSVHATGGRREAWGVLENIDERSPDRVAPVCPVQGSCGGCALMHLGYSAQLAWKQSRVRVEFAKHPALAAVDVEACVPSSLAVGYRNQAKYVYTRSLDGGGVLGAYAPRSHAVVDLAGCRVVEPILDQARGVLLNLLRAHEVEPYHEINRTGLLRYVVLRANAAGRVLATLVSARAQWSGADAVASACMSEFPAFVGVVLNVNSSGGNALFGEDERVLAGQASFEDEIGDVRVRLASRSFFQANRAVASRIYRDLVARLPGDLGRAVDAYSGAAGIALSLASRAREVIAIEQNAAATAAASESKGERVQIITGDAAQGLSSMDAADLVVLNPPRKGCTAEVLAQVLRMTPRLVAYLSCDPRSLAHDIGVLVKAGATITSVVPYDMMPHTPHVETLVVLSLRG